MINRKETSMALLTQIKDKQAGRRCVFTLTVQLMIGSPSGFRPMICQETHTIKKTHPTEAQVVLEERGGRVTLFIFRITQGFPSWYP